MAKTKIPTVNEELLEKYMRHSVYIEQLKKSEAKLVSNYLKKSTFPQIYKKLIRELKKSVGIKGLVGETQKVSVKHLTRMLAATQKISAAGMVKIEEVLVNRLGNISRFEAKWNKNLLEKTVPLDISLDMPNTTVLKTLVNTVTMDGAKLGAWMKGFSVATKTALMKQVKVGIATGESIKDIGKRINNALGWKGKQAGYIARTAVSSVVHQAREEVFTRNADLIKDVQWVSTLDDRTTLICINYDGRLLNEEGIRERPPAHFNCRSTVIPVTASWKEYGIKDPPPAMRASMTGTVPAKINYKDWLAQKATSPEGRKDIISILGPTRAKLYLEKKISIDRFVSRDYKPLTLKQLAKREGISLKELKAEPLRAIKTIEAMPVKGTGVKLTSMDKNALNGWSWYEKPYSDITKVQRGLKPEFVSKSVALKAEKRIFNALEKMKGYSGTTYRGMTFDTAAKRATFLKQFKSGRVWKSKTFMASSKSEKAIRKITKQKNSLTMIIKGKSGRDISKFAVLSEEKEVLFMKGIPCKVVKVQGNKIWLEEITKQAQLKALPAPSIKVQAMPIKSSGANLGNIGSFKELPSELAGGKTGADALTFTYKNKKYFAKRMRFNEQEQFLREAVASKAMEKAGLGNYTPRIYMAEGTYQGKKLKVIASEMLEDYKDLSTLDLSKRYRLLNSIDDGIKERLVLQDYLMSAWDRSASNIMIKKGSIKMLDYEMAFNRKAPDWAKHELMQFLGKEKIVAPSSKGGTFILRVHKGKISDYKFNNLIIKNTIDSVDDIKKAIDDLVPLSQAKEWKKIVDDRANELIKMFKLKVSEVRAVKTIEAMPVRATEVAVKKISKKEAEKIYESMRAKLSSPKFNRLPNWQQQKLINDKFITDLSKEEFNSLPSKMIYDIKRNISNEYRKTFKFKLMDREAIRNNWSETVGGLFDNITQVQSGRKITTKIYSKEELLQLGREIERGLDCIPATGGISYRGLLFNSEQEYSKFVAMFKEGEIYKSKQLLASSTKEEIGKKFAELILFEKINKPVFIKIKGLSGRDITKFSVVRKEAEILFKSGTPFKVEKVFSTKIGNIMGTEIHLTELSPTRAVKGIEKLKAASFNKIHSDYQKIIGKKVDDLVNKFPEVKNKFGGINLSLAKEFKIIDEGTDAFAVTATKKGKEIIYLSPKYFGIDSKFNMDKGISILNKKGWLVGKNAKDIITHEFGHVLEKSLPISIQRKLYKFWLNAKPLEIESMKKQISNYAIQSSHELFAESFTQWQLGKASPMAKKVLRMAGIKL